MKTWLIVPLVLSALCLLWVWLANRRPRLSGVLWPEGMEISGSVSSPDLDYDGDVVLGCVAAFGTIRCRRLTIARGADVSASTIVAARIRVDGRLSGVKVLSAGRRLVIRGELHAEEVQARYIELAAGSRSVVLTAGGTPRIRRHPKAEVKGFFAGLDEMLSAGVVRRDRVVDGEDTVSEADVDTFTALQ